MSSQTTNSVPNMTPGRMKPQEELIDPFATVMDEAQGEYCRSIEKSTRERIFREEEQKRLEAFMRQANAD